MNRLKSALVIALCLVSICSFSQSQKHLKKNLTVFISGTFDTSYTISFDRKNQEKHGFEYADKKFQEAFSKLHLKVGPQSPSHHYTFVMDYDYGYRISAYKMQYTNLKGEIFDAANPNKPIGTFSYMGRYENDDVAEAIAAQLKNAK